MTKAEKELAKTSKQLNEFQGRVNDKMKMKIALELGCTMRTVETYISGKGKRLPFALELLKKLRKVAV